MIPAAVAAQARRAAYGPSGDPLTSLRLEVVRALCVEPALWCVPHLWWQQRVRASAAAVCSAASTLLVTYLSAAKEAPAGELPDAAEPLYTGLAGLPEPAAVTPRHVAEVRLRWQEGLRRQRASFTAARRPAETREEARAAWPARLAAYRDAVRALRRVVHSPPDTGVSSDAARLLLSQALSSPAQAPAGSNTSSRVYAGAAALAAVEAAAWWAAYPPSIQSPLSVDDSGRVVGLPEATLSLSDGRDLLLLDYEGVRVSPGLLGFPAGTRVEAGTSLLGVVEAVRAEGLAVGWAGSPPTHTRGLRLRHPAGLGILGCFSAVGEATHPLFSHTPDLSDSVAGTRDAANRLVGVVAPLGQLSQAALLAVHMLGAEPPAPATLDGALGQWVPAPPTGAVALWRAWCTRAEALRYAQVAVALRGGRVAEAMLMPTAQATSPVGSVAQQLRAVAQVTGVRL